MLPPKPRKELDSKRIQNSLRANILTLISDDLKAVACRAVWRVRSEDLELALLQITSKRLQIDDVLSSITGVQFFFSAITCVNTNSKTSESDHVETTSYPAIAYFVVYRESPVCNEDTLYKALHNHDVEPEITAIKVRTQRSPDHQTAQMETAARQLFQVVKDHKNETVQEMIDVSNTYCYRNADDSTDDDDDAIINPTHFPTLPCTLVVVNQQEFSDDLLRAVDRLRSDGLQLSMDVTHDEGLGHGEPCETNEVATIVKQIEKAMKLCNHALYRSQVYAKPDGATFTYSRMMDVTSYIHKLLSNRCLRAGVIRHFHMIEKLLSHPACEVIQQLTFELDLIEVTKGFCFSIRSHKFIRCPIDETLCGKVSPRAFVSYDCSTPPEPSYFRDAIMNSFEDPAVRVNFLNKFFQCLMASQMPQKVRKLVVAGPKDSGKTSWANIFHRIVPSECIASITNERQFSASMITNDTQLVIVDEWSPNTMQSDLAKTILQGGWMITAVKHGEPRRVINNSPFYITTNHVPDFGDEEENVQRRIKVFTTTSLPSTSTGIDRWIYDHAMDCIAWIADELEEHHDDIAKEELWYESRAGTTALTIESNKGDSLFQSRYLSDLTPGDLKIEAPTCSDSASTSLAIHDNFVIEFRSRQLARRRTQSRQSVMETDEESTPTKIVLRDSGSSTPPRIQSDGDDDEMTTPPRRNVIHPPATPPMAVERESSFPDRPSTSINEENDPADADLRIQADGNDDDLDDLDMTTPPSLKVIHRPATPPKEVVFPNGPSTSAIQENDDRMEMPMPTPTQGWQINSAAYMEKVAHVIKWTFYKTIKKGHAYSFQECYRKAKLRRSPAEKHFWKVADPAIDASLLMLGQTMRDVFDLQEFARKQPNVTKDLQRLRRDANVRVHPTRCPYAKALELMAVNEEPATAPPEEEDTDRDGDPKYPTLSSQTYWTKIKGWRPW